MSEDYVILFQNKKVLYIKTGPAYYDIHISCWRGLFYVNFTNGTYIVGEAKRFNKLKDALQYGMLQLSILERKGGK